MRGEILENIVVFILGSAAVVFLFFLKVFVAYVAWNGFAHDVLGLPAITSVPQAIWLVLLAGLFTDWSSK